MQPFQLLLIFYFFAATPYPSLLHCGNNSEML